MSRPTASKRAVRRRYAIYGVLAERGPLNALAIAEPLRRNGGAIYADLAWMESEGLIVGEWEDDYIARTTQTMPIRPPDLNKPRRRLYRIAKPG